MELAGSSRLVLSLLALIARHATGFNAPVVANTGHDFALLTWSSENGTRLPATAYRVFSSEWGLSHLKYHSPDLTGSYYNDGDMLEVCTRPDGVQGEWRLVAYFTSSRGGFNGMAVGRWSVPDGGYLGGMVNSNTSIPSGARLIFSHRDGSLRLLGSGYDLGLQSWREPEETTHDYAHTGDGGAACRLMPPAKEQVQPEAPDITGHYFSRFNESLAVCTSNGTLLSFYSGLDGLQGFAYGLWNGLTERWEGLVADADGRPASQLVDFHWEVDRRDGGLTGEWTVYNRTWQWPDVNGTAVADMPPGAFVPPPWYAERTSSEAEAAAMAGGKLSLWHLCGLLNTASEGEERWGAVGHAADAPSTRFAPPQFPLLNCTNSTSTSNATYECTDPTETHDARGYFRRAPVEQIFAWAADTVRIVETATAAPRAVVASLAMGGLYRFRVASLLPHAPPPRPMSECDAGAPCGRCLLLLDKAACPTRPDLPLRCDAAPAGQLCEADGECATNQDVDNCGGFDVYEVLYLEHTTTYEEGAPSGYSAPLRVAASGPGPAVELTTRRVGATSIHLQWATPLVDASNGVWHGDGGAPMLGYRVLLRVAARADAAAPTPTLIGSTAGTDFLIEGLPPQTLFVVYVTAENTASRGLNSSELSVATRGLRAELYSECGHTTEIHAPRKYQGCFRDAPAAPVMEPPVEGAPFDPQLSAETCAARCDGHEYFGMRAGGVCRCGGTDSFDAYGAVPDAQCDTPCMGDAARACGGAARVSVYRQAGFRGVLLGVGDYHSFDLMRLRLPPRALSSVRIPHGLVLTLHQHDAFGGLSVNLTAADAPAVLRCLSAAPCLMPPSTQTWAVPPKGCDGGTWDDAATSVRLRYVGAAPPYTPRPNQETAARAFELSTMGKLSRLYDLGGDLGATAADRAATPGGATVTSLFQAPRLGDSDECASQTGGYTADRVCTQPAHIAYTAPTQLGHENSYYAWWRALPSRTYTDEAKRLAREEWRAALRAYASPFYDELLLTGQLNATTKARGGGGLVGTADGGYEAWFKQWLQTILPLLPLLAYTYGNDEGTYVRVEGDETQSSGANTPLLGFDDVGEVVAFADATAPTLPDHPLPAAEDVEAMLTAEAAAASSVPSLVAAAAEAFAARAKAAAEAADAPDEPTEEEVYELLQEEYDKGTAAAEVKAALHAHALRAGDPNATEAMVAKLESRSPDGGEPLFGEFR